MKRTLLVLVLLLLVAPLGLLLAALEAEPRVPAQQPATPADARRAQEILGGFWILTQRNIGAGAGTLVVSERDLNSTLRFATRAVPIMRGVVEVRQQRVRLVGALELPRVGWLNVTADVAESDDGLEIEAFNIGSIPLPPGFVLPTLRSLLDFLLGDGLGQVAVEGIGSVKIAGDRVALGVAMNRVERKALMERAKERARRVAGMLPADHVRRYWLALDRAAAAGPASRYRSFAGYLSQAVSLAAEAASNGGSSGSPQREMQAALLALAIYCGHARFEKVVGNVIPAEHRQQQSPCASSGLGGRVDLRQHFAVSMGLKTASDAGFAFAIGEFKELLDATRGGSGFSFDDIAADRAGIHFAKRILAVGPEEWRAVAAAIASEDAIFPSIEGLPSHMPEAEFKRRFGAVDSAAYKAMLREIDTRIARLPLFALL